MPTGRRYRRSRCRRQPPCYKRVGEWQLVQRPYLSRLPSHCYRIQSRGCDCTRIQRPVCAQMAPTSTGTPVRAVLRGRLDPERRAAQGHARALGPARRLSLRPAGGGETFLNPATLSRPQVRLPHPALALGKMLPWNSALLLSWVLPLICAQLGFIDNGHASSGDSTRPALEHPSPENVHSVKAVRIPDNQGRGPSAGSSGGGLGALNHPRHGSCTRRHREAG